MLQRTSWISLFVVVSCGSLSASEGPRCPPSITTDKCREDGSALDEYFFYLNGEKLTIAYEEQYLHITCLANVSLESEELPRFRRVVEVPRVKLTACGPPAGGYAAALRALNVTVVTVLELTQTPAAPALRAPHLRGMRAAALMLSAAATPLRPDDDFLQPLLALRDLRLADVRLSAAAALMLPPALRSLTVQRAELLQLMQDVFARLPDLDRLVVRDQALQALELTSARALREVAIEAPLDGVALGPALAQLRLSGVRRAVLRGSCAALRGLQLERAPVPAADWLQGCAVLQLLAVRSCALAELPPSWLKDAPSLISLDLSYNNLESLPSEMINLAKQLEKLDLTGNRLTIIAVKVIAGLPRLRALTLDRNPLNDLCGASDELLANTLSPLYRAHGLQNLSLVRTNATRICRDWRLDLRRLAALDLRHNRLPQLEAADLQWRRVTAATVDLRSNPVRRVEYSLADYHAALAAPSPAAPAVRLLLDARLRCDCGDYWYLRAALEAPQHAAKLEGARCEGREKPLLELAPRDLQCVVPAKACPRGCSCRATPSRSEMRCAAAGLTAVPRASSGLPPPRTLLLPGNNITHLAPEDLPHGLEILDLTDNQITELDSKTASVIAAAAPTLQLFLAGNPLRCDCNALPVLRLLANATCTGGESAPAAAVRLRVACAPPALALWPLAAAAAALCVVSAGAAACLARPRTRHRLKRFLRERGLCARWARDAEAGAAAALVECDRDVFVSYAEEDAVAAAALAVRLERGRRRLVLHERDWLPGELIPTQIAASVRRARRTVALVSPAFLRSHWARAELRLAAGAGRLLVVLLPGVDAARAAAADPLLHEHFSHVTYLRWEDPRFWTKLERALPPMCQKT